MDIIQLLPDHVANQIAAGEVVQRPASVVKELLENAIDAQADHIQLIVKDSGKTLIQVIDNGCGMSDTDARMSFERHATSKLNSADDLFKLTTKGFRGEALASIAAVAQVELKTNQTDDDLGSSLCIEGSEVKNQEPCSCPKGTSIAVKNLFFNVPARRNFLKSNQVELRHILDEFHRVSLAHCQVGFSVIHNGNELFRLPKSNLSQRISSIFGHKSSQKWVPVEEETDIVHIRGYIAKPEFAKKSRGEQFLFVNDRFIKSNYLNHAVTKAFEGLLSAEQFPGYFLFLSIAPEKIDVNIHPTKTEIKFEDEKAIYAIIRSTVKKSLGQFNIVPSLDFDKDPDLDQMLFDKPNSIALPTIEVNPDFNPFEEEKKQGSSSPNNSASYSSTSTLPKPPTENWQDLYQDLSPEKEQIDLELPNEGQHSQFCPWIHQLFQGYIISSTKDGLIVLDQYKVHFRVLYEQYLKQLERDSIASQQLLFPIQIALSSIDHQLLSGVQEGLQSMGFDFETIGKETLVINGIPLGCKESEIPGFFESICESQWWEESLDLDGIKAKLAKQLAQSMAVKKGTKLEVETMRHMLEQWFACKDPYHCPNGGKVLLQLGINELQQQFNG